MRRPEADQRRRSGDCPPPDPQRARTWRSCTPSCTSRSPAAYLERDYLAAHTIGLEGLEERTREATPEWAAEICGVSPEDIRRAAEIFGTSERVVSTVSMGFHQSHQATASSCQVNNLHLLRGMLGRPGAGILQMSGQPSAEKNRETGCGPALPGFRNWNNPEHVRELAELWNVEELVIPHWAPPTDGMTIFRYAEQGSIGFLWIAGTNPAVSMPELARVRQILAGEQCFVVVSDAYRTETTDLADVVLPSALWAEKTGTFTNVDRTIHLQEQAVDAPGQAAWRDSSCRVRHRARVCLDGIGVLGLSGHVQLLQPR